MVLMFLVQYREKDHYSAYSSLPRIGARPLICVPRAARTCCDVSETKSSTLVIISLSRVSLSNSPQKPCSSQFVAFNETGEANLTWYLPSYSGPNLCFRILQ